MKTPRYMILLLALLLGGCADQDDQPDAWGTFEATEITVSAMANGKLLQFTVQEGVVLDSGQLVGFVDTTDLYLKKRQTIDQRNATASRKTDLQAQISVQEQNRENILVEKNRLENLLKAGAATQKQMDDVTAALRLADRQIAAIRSQFGGLDDQIGSINQQIAQVEEAIRNAYVVNPLKGTVLVKYAEPEEVVAFGKPLYKIADLREMILRVYISGSQLPHVVIGDEVQVQYDRDEKSNSVTTGTISWISPTAEFTPKTIQTKAERVNLVYAVKVRVTNDGAMKIGMPGEIKLINP
ncbi:MAG: HlyD family efflux transporter periplasmic adaptor subunit [Bacteroidetes bacterium]|nr:MAG: HlyD family efflux transporter periplasmic adaptor subunit [Bacteroidota bacterium]